MRCDPCGCLSRRHNTRAARCWREQLRRRPLLVQARCLPAPPLRFLRTGACDVSRHGALECSIAECAWTDVHCSAMVLIKKKRVTRKGAPPTTLKTVKKVLVETAIEWSQR